ncbi:MAG: carbamate kinase, partial [Rhizobacter sp.]|nr:carbamate kinase [Rhizobacter sp.]
LLRRDQAPTADHQLENIRSAAAQIARVATGNELVLTHGNGPQVGLLALQAIAYTAVQAYPLDMLGAQTDGMIGYLLEQELSNLLPSTRRVATLITRVAVDPLDPAFKHPTKPIGPVYTQREATRLAAELGWSIAADGAGYRRVVASPRPLRVLAMEPVRWLLDKGAVVIAAGGGAIPVAAVAGRPGSYGVEAVIDKDLCSGLLARQLEADCLVIATDVDAVYLDWGKPTRRAVGKVSPGALSSQAFQAGSMGPKVEAACEFTRQTGKPALIGSLTQIDAMLAGQAGTRVCVDGATVL